VPSILLLFDFDFDFDFKRLKNLKNLFFISPAKNYIYVSIALKTKNL